jgi:hypothetical protein
MLMAVRDLQVSKFKRKLAEQDEIQLDVAQQMQHMVRWYFTVGVRLGTAEPRSPIIAYRNTAYLLSLLCTH